MALLPKPPEPVVSVDVWGVKNAVLKAFFWPAFFFFAWEFVRRDLGHVTGQDVSGALFMAFLLATQWATTCNKIIVSWVNEDREQQHAAELKQLQENQPITHDDGDEAGPRQP